MSIPEICWQVAHWNNDEKYQRRIVSAANRYELQNGEPLVIPCVRHYSKEHHPILTALKGIIKTRHVVEPNQGFIDQYSNYWTREEAMVIATHAGQVKIDRCGPETMLFSEDLY
ncbi:Hypothetical protein KNT65_gp165 [Escherichia phage EcS1]|uniref:Uncharacterized protein n=1 Tax=Escherichia phage EcS1 TaxID=2083276 RepID=A0A2Z5ZCD6_9CAUD|nr:Hypothetical protein KNT65_gp165 [Escherichia phage EcS1]BBC78328.1 Hypothetical protein [Escherichia phage EcS1]